MTVLHNPPSRVPRGTLKRLPGPRPRVHVLRSYKETLEERFALSTVRIQKRGDKIAYQVVVVDQHAAERLYQGKSRRANEVYDAAIGDDLPLLHEYLRAERVVEIMNRMDLTIEAYEQEPDGIQQLFNKLWQEDADNDTDGCEK